MPKVYKICILKDNKISEIYVFNGRTEYGDNNVQELYKSDKRIV